MIFSTGLGRRLLGLVLLFSTAIAVIFAAIQSAAEYQDEMSRLERRLTEIEIADSPSIAYGLWKFDRSSLRGQLDGLMRTEGIGHVDLRSNVRNIWSSFMAGGARSAGPALTRDIPLNHTLTDGKIVLIGSLHVEAPLGEIYISLFYRGLIILAVQIIKTLLISAFILVLVHRLITRHLLSIADHLHRFSLDNGALALDRRPPSTPDELDLIVDAFNERGDLLLQARADSLTGLSNRRWFDAQFATEWGRAERQGAPLALLLIDLDHFKAFNDTYGHKGGDEVLIRVGRALQAVCKRPSDLTARIGGEEFACLLPDTDVAGAESLAQDLCRAVRSLAIPHEAAAASMVTVSIGASAIIPSDDLTSVDFFKAVDRLLYSAKASGRDQVRSAAL